MTDLTPGSKWWLPVEFMHLGGPMIEDENAGWFSCDSETVLVRDLSALIPADRITELEAANRHLGSVYDMADALMGALRAYGYPVLDAHWQNNSENMSREARDLHLAAVNLRAALEGEALP